MSQSITAAVIQQAVDGNDKEQNLDRTEALVREAVEQGAELVDWRSCTPRNIFVRWKIRAVSTWRNLSTVIPTSAVPTWQKHWT